MNKPLQHIRAVFVPSPCMRKLGTQNTAGMSKAVKCRGKFMKIEHVALYVNDLEAAKDFFVRFLGARPGELYHNVQTGFKSYFLSFDGGARLEIMTRPSLGKSGPAAPQTGYAHLAFSVGSREKVDALTLSLRQAGYETLSGPRTTGDGYYESCVAGPENNLIEITE